MIEQTLVTLATTILAGGLNAQVAPKNCARPYGVYQEISSPTSNTLSDGVPIQQSVMQIDVYADTYVGARTAGDALADAIQAAFDAGTLAGCQHSRRSLYEQETKLHRILYEFSFWYH